MNGKIIAGLTAAAMLVGVGAASADEVTKTTTTTTKTDPTVVVTTPPAGAVLGDDAGCSTKKVTKTDGETGDTVKKTATNC